MLCGRFDNCYGIKQLELPEIQFERGGRNCNKVLIYSPNGVMKSSFSRVFEDISKGRATGDRIFQGASTKYDIQYRDQRYTYDSETQEEDPTAAEGIYVINSFDDKFEFTRETVGTLLADEETRNEYDALVREFSTEQRQLVTNLNRLTGLSRTKVKDALMADFELPTDVDWPDILEKVAQAMPGYRERSFMEAARYVDLFNEKTMGIYANPEFVQSIAAYADSLSGLLSNSMVLTPDFTDRSAEELTRAFSNNNLFGAQHRIRLRNGITVNSLEQWNRIISDELNAVYETPALATEFQRLKRLMTGTSEARCLRAVIVARQEIIPFLQDVPELKRQFWMYCFSHLDRPFTEYCTSFSRHTVGIRQLYQRAAEQSELWEVTVTEFNRRFRVPFEVKINNKANFLLKDEAPNLSFVYTRGTGEALESADVGKEDLMVTLSMGEKRALYLLYILFDLAKVRQRAQEGLRTLILADDVADSFDYKNKYAIIEYLNDLAQTPSVDLIMLTHNFDFFRTLWLRLNVDGNNAFMAQKNPAGIIQISKFPYREDYFKNVVIPQIRNGRIDTDRKQKFLIASVPFYRNICDYSQRSEESDKLTCLLHIKTEPINTQTVRLSELWEIINCFLSDIPFVGTDAGYYETLHRLAAATVAVDHDEISLENKLLVAIAVRLKAEEFLREKLVEHGIPYAVRKDQTRKWFNLAKDHLSSEERGVIEEVLLITPENIHLNSFMFEPLIDISDWILKDLYIRVSALV